MVLFYYQLAAFPVELKLGMMHCMYLNPQMFLPVSSFYFSELAAVENKQQLNKKKINIKIKMKYEVYKILHFAHLPLVFQK